MSERQALIERLIRADVRAMHAYAVADARGMIKLDAMESPFPWPGDLHEAWCAALSEVSANRYPDPRAPELTAQLRAVMAIDDRWGVLLGNGSDEIIQLLVQAVAQPGAVVMAPAPGFAMYGVYSQINHVDYVGVPLRADFQLDLPALQRAFAETPPALFFLASPNNPTGIRYPLEDIEQVIRACPGLVVLDEAYIAYTEQNGLNLLAEHSNLVVMRTVSKVGLAGLRLGFLVGDPALLHEIDKVRPPYNVNSLTQVSATFALQHYPQLQALAQQLCEQRLWLTDELAALPGVTVFPSEANFLLLRVPAGKARPIFAALKQDNVLIKCLDGGHPLLTDCLRVNVSTPDEGQAFLQAFKRALSNV